MTINRRTITEAARQKAKVGRIVDTTTADLILAWARAWDEIAADLEDTITAGLTGSRRLRARKQREALRIVSLRLLALCDEAGDAITADARQLVELAAMHQTELIGTQLPKVLAVQLERTDPRQVEAIVKRTTQQITARHRQLHHEAQVQMRRELMRSVAVGDNPREAARRMVKGLRQPFDGGLTRAMVIARTETLDAYRTASQAAQDANSDVLAGWRWMATLSRRTCPSCLAHHGELHELKEPGPLDHHQGRCARVPETKSWAELGFSGIAETKPAIREGDGARWLKSQPADVQRDVLGSKRYDAYKAGDYPPEAWSVKRSAEGWRDSYHVGPV